ncbi:MAG TPA: membrane-binding protein [Flavobacterium sp.]|jgi:antitoxin component YwqK of YwqJK toxin-antitoxin module
MKMVILSAMMLASTIISAQDVSPKLEAQGNLVKATYYYENGLIRQEGFFKDGKLDGKWIAYDTNGNKKSIGEYSNGEKTGKWFFWNESILSEVDYSSNKIAAIKSWKEDALVNRN